MLTVRLVTRGAPGQVTGGHLFHARMAEAAGARDASIEFVPAWAWRNPLRRARGVVVVDSITAWSAAPWAALGRYDPPLAAILHQPPGGVGQGRVRRRAQQPLDRTFYRRCELLLVASQALAADLVTNHGLRAERLCVVEPGCDVGTAAAETPPLRGGRRIALLCVANWLPNKGVLELLDAVAALPPDRATLHLAGRDDLDPRYRTRVRARLAAADLVDRVVVHGALGRTDVARLYAGADAFVLPSYAETYGTVYGEALACGLPTVGWRSGNLPNLVSDGREGCLVPPGDVAGLTAALERLATDDPWRVRLSAAARRRGARLPTWDDTADVFFGALHRLAARSVGVRV